MNLLIRVLIRVIVLLLNLNLLPILHPTLSTFTVILVHLVDAVLFVGGVVECVERLENSTLTLEDPAVDPPWKSLGELVVHVGACWDGEDVVEFLECTLLGLGDPEEDHNERDNVRAGIEAEDSLQDVSILSCEDGTCILTVVPIAESMSGKNKVRTQAQNKQVATAQPIPTSR